jgi:hypothetical protein
MKEIKAFAMHGSKGLQAHLVELSTREQICDGTKTLGGIDCLENCR